MDLRLQLQKTKKDRLVNLRFALSLIHSRNKICPLALPILAKRISQRVLQSKKLKSPAVPKQRQNNKDHDQSQVPGNNKKILRVKVQEIVSLVMVKIWSNSILQRAIRNWQRGYTGRFKNTHWASILIRRQRLAKKYRHLVPYLWQIATIWVGLVHARGSFLCPLVLARGGPRSY